MTWDSLLGALVLASLGLVAFAYLGYPALIWAASRLFGREPRRPDVDDRDLPAMTVLIVGFNEEAEIRQRIENALEMDYPPEKLQIVIASDGSTDGTNEIVRCYERFGARLLAFPTRSGKAAVLNAAIPQLGGEIVMLSDANTYTRADAAQRLAAWFADPAVGVVCGRLILTDPATGSNVDSLYWKYETFLKKCESRLGALLGSNGGIYAIRKSLFQGIPANTIVDDFVIPLLARKRSGCRLVYDKEAVAIEETPTRITSEFHRRARIGAGGFQSIGLLAGLLNPAHGWISLTFALHKILRWLCPFAMLTALVANVFLINSTPFRYLLFAQVGFYLLALAAGQLPARPRVLRYPRVTTIFTMVNIALLVGFLRWVRGGQSAAWKRTARLREGPRQPASAVEDETDRSLPLGANGT
jgi:cellulose synthase/poly-beta-1,6-N-acetylglucosamine synthase-like glycosyltransferase